MANTIPCLVPFSTTGNICLRSPPDTITLPSKGRCKLSLSTYLIISLKLLSSASKQYLCIIGASSQMISFVLIRDTTKFHLGRMPTQVALVEYLIIVAVVLLRFYPYAAIYHVKINIKYKIKILRRFLHNTATIWYQQKIF